MQIPYPVIEKIKINQTLKPPTEAMAGQADSLLAWLPPEPAAADFAALPHGQLLAERWKRRKPGPVATELPNPRGTRTRLADIDPDADAFNRLTRARKQIAPLIASHTASLIIDVSRLPADQQQPWAEAALLAALSAVCPRPSLKAKPDPSPALRQIRVTGLDGRLAVARLVAEAQGNYLSRWLAELPGNELTPKRYRALIEQIARAEGWKTEFLDEATLRRRKAGAFLAVTQGSPDRSAGILRLRYRPGGRTRKGTLALVGKGICFDTGGVNLKTARYMHGMHEDMTGSAVALGTLLALTRQGFKHPVDCWLALAENHIGPNAYKPNDVVRAANGTTIEIIHTDAEGRMVLADTLALAGRQKPACIIDYATLTGTCVYSLSSRYSGVFTNKASLHNDLIAAGRTSGERVWPFPMDSDFDDALKSDIADIKQCTIDSEADHILAARFLQRFVPESSTWVHVDLSAHNHKGGLGHVGTDITGFGVRFTLELLNNIAPSLRGTK